MQSPILSVIVITYNQEKFIRETLDSIVKQQTTFDFEVIIGQDASTDKTQEICDEYSKKFPSKIKVLNHNKNLGLVANFMAVYNEARGRYIASVGGDDYWIDELKLQKQFDFLESNLDYALCVTRWKEFIDNENKFIDAPIDSDIDIQYDKLCLRNPICAPTAMYRRNLIPKLGEDFKLAPVEDWVLWLMYGKKGKIRCLKDITTVYRIHDNSMFDSLKTGKQLLWRFNSRLYIKDNFSVETDEEFYNNEKLTIRGVLVSDGLSKKEKVDFLNTLSNCKSYINLKWLNFLIKLPLFFNKPLIWRYLN